MAIAVREDIEKECQPVDDLETQDQEVVWIQVNTKGKRKISVGVYYGKQEKEQLDIILFLAIDPAYTVRCPKFYGCFLFYGP